MHHHSIQIFRNWCCVNVNCAKLQWPKSQQRHSSETGVLDLTRARLRHILAYDFRILSSLWVNFRNSNFRFNCCGENWEACDKNEQVQRLKCLFLGTYYPGYGSSCHFSKHQFCWCLSSVKVSRTRTWVWSFNFMGQEPWADFRSLIQNWHIGTLFNALWAH